MTTVHLPEDVAHTNKYSSAIAHKKSVYINLNCSLMGSTRLVIFVIFVHPSCFTREQASSWITNVTEIAKSSNKH